MRHLVTPYRISILSIVKATVINGSKVEIFIDVKIVTRYAATVRGETVGILTKSHKVKKKLETMINVKESILKESKIIS
jgi:hypothetical protein